MLSILVLVFFVIALFKLTALFFRVVGKLLGWIIGVIGWLFLAGLAVTVLGLYRFRGERAMCTEF